MSIKNRHPKDVMAEVTAIHDKATAKRDLAIKKLRRAESETENRYIEEKAPAYDLVYELRQKYEATALAAFKKKRSYTRNTRVADVTPEGILISWGTITNMRFEIITWDELVGVGNES